MSYSTRAICTFTWTWWVVLCCCKTWVQVRKYAMARTLRLIEISGLTWPFCKDDAGLACLWHFSFTYVSIYLLDTSPPCRSDSARLNLWVLQGGRQIIELPLILSNLCWDVVLKSCNFARTCNKQYQQQQKGSSDQRMIRQCNVSINV